jgi:hypothetical protein
MQIGIIETVAQNPEFETASNASLNHNSLFKILLFKTFIFCGVGLDLSL